MKLLITGGAGFIGSNFIRYILANHHDYYVTNLDKLTYAGNLDNLRDIEGHPHYRFIKGDICDTDLVDPLAKETDVVLNFAAETHVDRSIIEPGSFIRTDVNGTYVLLETARRYNHKRYIQISTDEVYGSIESGSFSEESPIHPNSPYSASKASADLIVQSYFTTFKQPVIITRSSNNFGPYQYPEKFIPLFITNAIDDKPLPLYGDGLNIRDWIYVMDNCAAIDLVLHYGIPGEIYNIGGGNERTNLEVARQIIRELGKPEDIIHLVKDRPGHDRRYALDCRKIASLGFKPRHALEKALSETIRWYKETPDWWRKIKSGEFQKYYEKMYTKRDLDATPH